MRECTAFGLHIQMRVTRVNLFVAVTANLPADTGRHVRISQLVNEGMPQRMKSESLELPALAILLNSATPALCITLSHWQHSGFR